MIKEEGYVLNSSNDFGDPKERQRPYESKPSTRSKAKDDLDDLLK